MILVSGGLRLLESFIPCRYKRIVSFLFLFFFLEVTKTKDWEKGKAASFGDNTTLVRNKLTIYFETPIRVF